MRGAMRNSILAICLVVGVTTPGHAQEAARIAVASGKKMSGSRAASYTSSAANSIVNSAALPTLSIVGNAGNSDSPTKLAAPDSDRGEPDDNAGQTESVRLEVEEGYSMLSFRSTEYSRNLQGVNSGVSYYFRRWLGLECSVTAGFGARVFDREFVKAVVYEAGPRIVLWQGKWQPWMHALAGGVHMLPQTADNSQNAIGVQAGGGLDYRWKPNWGVRIESDWLHTDLFQRTQNNFQFAAGVVIKLR
jgi:hypothetical protein